MKVIMMPGRVAENDNPYINILVEGIRANGVDIQEFAFRKQNGVDAFHVHWLEAVFWGRLSKRFGLLARRRADAIISQARLVRAFGGRVVWTIHNLSPHDGLSASQRPTWDLLRRQFLPLVTDVIVMSSGTVDEAKRFYSEVEGATFHVVPHPHYRDFFSRYQNEVAVNDPEILKISSIGMLRPYKGILESVHSLKSTADKFHFTIAGSGSAEYVKKIRNAIGDDVRFTLINKRLSHVEFCKIVSGSDVILFNFRSILNSGSVLASLSIGVPVITPTSDSISDLAEMVGPDWTRTFDGAIDASAILDQARQLKRGRSLARSINLNDLSPQSIGRTHKDIYAGKNDIRFE